MATIMTIVMVALSMDNMLNVHLFKRATKLQKWKNIRKIASTWVIGSLYILYVISVFLDEKN